jgi:hypothetical protein
VSRPPGKAKVLELRPNCECCNRDLPPEAADVITAVTLSVTHAALCAGPANPDLSKRIPVQLAAEPVRSQHILWLRRARLHRLPTRGARAGSPSFSLSGRAEVLTNAGCAGRSLSPFLEP